MTILILISMSEKKHYTDSKERSSEEKILLRLNKLIEYKSDLLDRVQHSRFKPYCHIPDLFELDPEVSRPYSVPSTFISEEVGGNVSVTNTDGTFLGNESLNFMLSSFLPGGFKRRWEFEIWKGNFEPSSRSGFADISRGIGIRSSKSLKDILQNIEKEKYTPYNYNTEKVKIYIPSQFRVRDPSVNEESNFVNYYWDEKRNFVHNRKPDEVQDKDLTELKSDPTSQFLWFKHLLSSGEENISQSLNNITNDLFLNASFSDGATFLKCYYATLLTLYGEEKTFSGVTRYSHDEDDSIAFVGSEEKSQIILFKINRDRVNEILDDVLKKEDYLYRDLQFAMLYKKIWDKLFFQKEALSHAFSVDPFYTVLIAVDYMFSTLSEHPHTIFNANISQIKDQIPSLLPENQLRLGLLNYSEEDLNEYVEILDNYEDTISSIISECSEKRSIRDFAEHVLVHSLKHALASWAAEYSAGGTNFEAWYDINFKEKNKETIEVGIYDSIQGGSGISKEVFEDIKAIEDNTFLTGLSGQGCCNISATEETIISLLNDTPVDYLIDLIQSLDISNQKNIGNIKEIYNSLGVDYRHINYDDVEPFLRRRIQSLSETQELTRFYTKVAEEYKKVQEKTGRTPRSIDIIFSLENRTFFDPRVKRTYEKFANRRSQRRDISELAERVEEITRQCIHACPDCLKRQSCIHQYRYQEQMLDRRLLTRTLAQLEGSKK